MPEPTASENPSSILVVDDNEANRALAKETLEDEGYRVVLAESGREAIEKFQEAAVDCIVLDVRMPDLDGFSTCEQIRALPRGKETPVIFLTALRDVETFERALRAGGDDFLTKPVRPTELIVRVQAGLKVRQLRAELHEHYDLLRKQRDDLMRVQLQKERLMAFVVHDLKNPVNAMDLHAQILMRDQTLPPSARESAAHIRSEARVLSRMILNLLDLSKGDEGKLHPRASVVDLGALFVEIESELSATAATRNVSLVTATAPDAQFVAADPDLLRRALANLVENAIRHAPKKTEVKLSSTLMDDGVEIRVTDRGAGVPEKMRARVFDAFVQMAGEGRPEASGGRGLGLTFCKLVAEAHGGKISIEDASPGSTFCLSLPK